MHKHICLIFQRHFMFVHFVMLSQITVYQNKVAKASKHYKNME